MVVERCEVLVIGKYGSRIVQVVIGCPQVIILRHNGFAAHRPAIGPGGEVFRKRGKHLWPEYRLTQQIITTEGIGGVIHRSDIYTKYQVSEICQSQIVEIDYGILVESEIQIKTKLFN